MNFTTIAKWEFKGILSSRKFLMIFLLQISVLLLMIVVFNSFVANMESEEGISITPSLSGFASLDVHDESGLFIDRINPEILDIIRSDYNNSIKRVERGRTTGFLMVPDDAAASINIMEPVTLNLYLDYSDPKSVVVLDEVNSTSRIMSTAITASWVNSLSPQNTSTQNFKQQSSGESLPLQIINKVMIAIILFLPILLFGNIIMDSVVGEKERKTAEILIAMPMSHADIIIGKSIASILLIALQVVIWITILLLAGFGIKNPLMVYAFILMASVPIVGITTALSVYAKNYKEAGIGISILYIGVAGFLAVPALAYLSTRSTLANISPMTIVMRLFSGDVIPIGDYAVTVLFAFIFSVLSYGIAVKLFRRDDVVFGPRPGILRLLWDLISFKKV
ncbi:ABC transporter permease [Methanobacterium aggregans]|uniref:ABC transporter permease n=1 Tax=Methanobacterium aggregans TaxID=1615586 RepID=UPI001AE8A038|nr:ABC transporter permease [Methanobacterium aggregans]MBP2045911.1 ABC-2 type transport system permease protein [Methanobacterium aggregans]